MFVGHFALAFAAKRAAPGISLAIVLTRNSPISSR